MIELQDFSIGFDKRILLEKVNTGFEDRHLTALIGKNGSGKSTLMKALCGLNDKYSGKILLNGENLRKISRNVIASEIAYVNTQRPRIANLKCKDVVALGRSPYSAWDGRLSKEDLTEVKEAFTMVQMNEYEDRYFNTLSDGECQKIMIARAIAQDTSYILLDEPTSFLDLPTRYDLAKLLRNLTENEGKTILYSTHEIDIALKFSDNICLIDSPSLINLPVHEMKSYLKETQHSFSLFF